jgi:hypothetical protein
LNSRKSSLSPRQFIEEHVPEGHQQAFEDFLKENAFSLKQFSLDTSAIASHLRRLLFRGVKGTIVSVQADQADLVTVESDRIVVADSVASVG